MYYIFLISFGAANHVVSMYYILLISFGAANQDMYRILP